LPRRSSGKAGTSPGAITAGMFFRQDRDRCWHEEGSPCEPQSAQAVTHQRNSLTRRILYGCSAMQEFLATDRPGSAAWNGTQNFQLCQIRWSEIMEHMEKVNCSTDLDLRRELVLYWVGRQHLIDIIENPTLLSLCAENLLMGNIQNNARL
jgi:hypothetical protein